MNIYTKPGRLFFTVNADKHSSASSARSTKWRVRGNHSSMISLKKVASTRGSAFSFAFSREIFRNSCKFIK